MVSGYATRVMPARRYVATAHGTRGRASGTTRRRTDRGRAGSADRARWPRGSSARHHRLDPGRAGTAWPPGTAPEPFRRPGARTRRDRLAGSARPALGPLPQPTPGPPPAGRLTLAEGDPGSEFQCRMACSLDGRRTVVTGYHRRHRRCLRDGLVHGPARRSAGLARPGRDRARRARREHHRDRRRRRGHRRRADAHHLRRRPRPARRSPASGSRSRSTTRRAASSPTR